MDPGSLEGAGVSLCIELEAQNWVDIGAGALITCSLLQCCMGFDTKIIFFVQRWRAKYCYCRRRQRTGFRGKGFICGRREAEAE